MARPLPTVAAAEEDRARGIATRESAITVSKTRPEREPTAGTEAEVDPAASPRERIVQAARLLFGRKGFHSTPVAELAAAARVSVGQIYRFFPGKDDIIVAIVEESTEARMREMEQVFAEVRAGRSTAFEAVKAIARLSLLRQMSLSFEMLAEAYRNERVAAQLKALAERYRARIRELALLIRPDVTSSELEAYADILTACFFGMGHRTLIAPDLDVERSSHETACLLMQALARPGGEAGAT